MSSFARAVRAGQSEGTVASSVYLRPDYEEVNRQTPTDAEHVAIENKQDDQKRSRSKPASPTRVITRSGKILCADGKFRMPASHEAKYRHRARTVVETGSGYEASAAKRSVDAKQTARPLVELSQRPAAESYASEVLAHPPRTSSRRALQDARAINRHAFNQTLPIDAVFGGRESGRDDQTQAGSSRAVLQSKWSPDSDDQSTFPRLVRRLSNKAKGAFRRGSCTSIENVSPPMNFRDQDPHHPYENVLHPEIEAIPVAKAQEKFMRPARPPVSAPLRDVRREADPLGITTYPERSAAPVCTPSIGPAQRSDFSRKVERSDARYPHALKSRPSTSKKPSPPKVVLPPARACRPPHKLKVVGDRSTLFGDFIDAAVSDSDPDELTGPPMLPAEMNYGVPDVKSLTEQYSQPQLKPAPLLVPKRKPVPQRPPRPPESAQTPQRASSQRQANTPRYDWIPRKYPRLEVPPSLRTPARVSGGEDWQMDADFPTVDNLFGPLNGEAAAADIRHKARMDVKQDVHHKQAVLHQPPPDPTHAADRASEQEIMIDTFDHGQQATWVATQRPSSLAYQSEPHRLVYHEFVGQDQAAQLMERLRRLQAGKTPSVNSWEEE